MEGNFDANSTISPLRAVGLYLHAFALISPVVTLFLCSARVADLKVVVTAHPDKIQEAKQGAAAAASNTEEGGEGAESSQQSAVAQGSEDIDDSHFKQVKRGMD